MHTRARRLIFAVMLALIAIFLAWTLLYPREPVYHGKTLSAWAQQYGSNHWTANRTAADEAEFAIRQIGTNSIPFMLNLIRATDRPLTRKLRSKVPRKWHAALHLNDDSGNTRRMGAHAMAALGTNAPGAVPALIDLAKTHPDQDGRYIAVFALRTLGPAAEAAVPFYIQCLTNADATIRNEGAVGLVLIPRQWQVAMPHLIQYLEFIKVSNDPHRGWEMMHAVELFGQMGTNAQPAMPILLAMLNYPDANVRAAVTNSLPRIDADAAATAGVKRR